MEYKVVKEFGSAKKGDVLVTDDEGFAFFDVSEKRGNSEYTRSMMIDEEVADYLCETGYLTQVKDEDECCAECECCNCNYYKKVSNTLELVDKLLNKYESDNKEVQKKAENGEIQPCVKVEADTVYYNLSKVLNCIKKELTNEQTC